MLSGPDLEVTHISSTYSIGKKHSFWPQQSAGKAGQGDLLGSQVQEGGENRFLWIPTNLCPTFGSAIFLVRI